MTPDELIQLIRTMTIGQIREQLEKDYQAKSERYDHFVSFILAAHGE